MKEEDIHLQKVNPGDWRRSLRMKKKASEIKLWRVSKSNIAHAYRYLHGRQAAFSPNVPATPGRLKVKTR